jgi:hypothetical protein
MKFYSWCQWSKKEREETYGDIDILYLDFWKSQLEIGFCIGIMGIGFTIEYRSKGEK